MGLNEVFYFQLFLIILNNVYFDFLFVRFDKLNEKVFNDQFMSIDEWLLRFFCFQGRFFYKVVYQFERADLLMFRFFRLFVLFLILDYWLLNEVDILENNVLWVSGKK